MRDTLDNLSAQGIWVLVIDHCPFSNLNFLVEIQIGAEDCGNADAYSAFLPLQSGSRKGLENPANSFETVYRASFKALPLIKL
jgi:hypothetical protein